jgi:hypothetical protein
MKTIAYERSTYIQNEPELINRFLLQTKNLSSWTRFFQELHKEKNNFCKFKTPLGDAISTVRCDKTEGHAVFTIHSKFIAKKIKEKAQIMVSNNKQGAEVRFVLNLPAILPIEIIENQLFVLEQELQTLKTILEAYHE